MSYVKIATVGAAFPALDRILGALGDERKS